MAEYTLHNSGTMAVTIGMPVEGWIDDETLVTFGQALMAAAGADGEVSADEMNWLSAFMYSHGASEDALGALNQFDYKSANLDELVTTLLGGEHSLWASRALLEAAIRMMRVDRIGAEEFQAAFRIGDQLDLTPENVMEISDLITILEGLETSRRAASDRIQRFYTADGI